VHVARRTYVLMMVIAVLAVIGVWSAQEALAGLWRLPAALLLLGLALEGMLVRRLLPGVQWRLAPRAYLGRVCPAVLVFSNTHRRSVTVEYACAAPAGVLAPQVPRRVRVPGQGTHEDALSLLPVRLGPQEWPTLPARLRGPLALAWWDCALRPAARFSVAPDVRRGPNRVRGFASGVRSRRVAGAGQELYQLRGYVHGDPPYRLESDRAQRRINDA
jgi:uncharacterized protein (DUF58 family)